MTINTSILRAIILRNEIEDDHLPWIIACEKYPQDIEYRIVNLTSYDWYESIHKKSFDILLAKPAGLTAPYKQLYDERIFILCNVLKYRIFPSPMELFIYENKRFLYSWLRSDKIPHPTTWIFYNNMELGAFLKGIQYPIVAKSNIGASGSGVKILKKEKEVNEYIKRTYSGKGAPRRSGPNFSTGGLLKRGMHYILNPGDIGDKLKTYNSVRTDVQRGFVIFQEFIEHDYEWRVVRIGESFFAHKKLRMGLKASGTMEKQYDNPSMELLNFVKRITDQNKFYSVAIDLFESPQGFLVNEIQCIFGQSDPYQMLVDGNPGRYRYLNKSWLFEEGNFTENACFNLRIDFILSQHTLNT